MLTAVSVDEEIKLWSSSLAMLVTVDVVLGASGRLAGRG